MYRTRMGPSVIRRIGAALMACALLACPPKAKPVPAPEELPLEVDASEELGALSEVFSGDLWIAANPNSEGSYIYDKAFSELSLRKVQLTVDSVLGDSQSLTDYLGRLRQEFKYYIDRRNSQLLAERLVVVTFATNVKLMPNWLSTRAGDNRNLLATTGTEAGFKSVSGASPPQCYEWTCGSMVGWEQVAYVTAKFFNQEVGVNHMAISVGHEPNRDWLGTESSVFKLYEHTVRGAKRAVAEGAYVGAPIQFGGIGSFDWEGRKGKCNEPGYADYVKEMCTASGGWADPDGEPLTKNFIEYASAHSLPLDFLNVHAFGISPREFREETGPTMRKWLMGNGFGAQTPMYPADWTRWRDWYPSPYLDTEDPAAYIVSALVAMNSGGIAWHGHDFDVGVWTSGQGEFYGDWSVFTKSQVIKPMFNSLRLVSRFGGANKNKRPHQVRLSMPENEFVSAIATKEADAGAVRLLLTYFVPSAGELLNEYVNKPALDRLQSCLASKGYSEEETRLIVRSIGKAAHSNKPSAGLTPEYLSALVDKTTFPAPFSDSQVKVDAKLCVSDAGPLLEARQEELRNKSATVQTIHLLIRGLEPGDYSLKDFLIDGSHSNSCRYNKSTETDATKTLCGLNGDIDKKIALARNDAQKMRLQEAGAALAKKNYSASDIMRLGEVGKGVDWCQKARNQCLATLATTLETVYKTLERCQTNGVYDPIKCATSQVVQEEIFDAFAASGAAFDQEFFYNSQSSIDKINRLPGVALETVADSTAKLTQGKYEVDFSLTPNSVRLIELVRVSR